MLLSFRPNFPRLRLAAPVATSKSGPLESPAQFESFDVVGGPDALPSPYVMSINSSYFAGTGIGTGTGPRWQAQSASVVPMLPRFEIQELRDSAIMFV